MTALYTVQLSHGLGMVEETSQLLELWQEGMTGTELFRAALKSGRFSNMSARRLRDIAVVGFAPRYLTNGADPAKALKRLAARIAKGEFTQLLFLYTCRAHAILADFVCQVYWTAYTAGRQELSSAEALEFVIRAVHDGKTTTQWSDISVRRVAGNLTGSLADFGLLERASRATRKILPYQIEPSVAAILAYDLHLAGLGDNNVIAHPDWALFGLEPADVLNELKRLTLQGHLIVQSAGGATRISWNYKNMEELIDALAQRELR
jgi:Putative inner membrane protein (DUF1819)